MSPATRSSTACASRASTRAMGRRSSSSTASRRGRFCGARSFPPVLESGRRCIAPDLAGFGRSDKPLDLDWYTYDRHTELMTALLDELDISGATAVVHDWGGPIGLRVAVENPERFDRMVIMDSGLFTGRQRMSDAWNAFRDFVARTEDLPVSLLVRRACLTDPGDEVAAAYDAPFPTPASKAGPRSFPLILPTSPEMAGAEAGERVARALRKTIARSSACGPTPTRSSRPRRGGASRPRSAPPSPRSSRGPRTSSRRTGAPRSASASRPGWTPSPPRQVSRAAEAGIESPACLVGKTNASPMAAARSRSTASRSRETAVRARRLPARARRAPRGALRDAPLRGVDPARRRRGPRRRVSRLPRADRGAPRRAARPRDGVRAQPRQLPRSALQRAPQRLWRSRDRAPARHRGVVGAPHVLPRRRRRAQEQPLRPRALAGLDRDADPEPRQHDRRPRHRRHQADGRRAARSRRCAGCGAPSS